MTDPISGYTEKRYAYSAPLIAPFVREDGTIEPFDNVSVHYYTESERQKFMAMLSGGLITGSHMRVEKIGNAIGISIDDKLLMSIDRMTNLINRQERYIAELQAVVADLKEEILDLKEAVFNE